MGKGGKRQGAGAPKGNSNALKHGLRTRDGALKKTLDAFPHQASAIVARIIRRRTPPPLIDGRTPTYEVRHGSEVFVIQNGSVKDIRASSTKLRSHPDADPSLTPGPDSAKHHRKEKALADPPFCPLCEGPRTATRIRLAAPGGHQTAVQYQCVRCLHLEWPPALRSPVVPQVPRQGAVRRRRPSRRAISSPYWTRD